MTFQLPLLLLLGVSSLHLSSATWPLAAKILVILPPCITTLACWPSSKVIVLILAPSGTSLLMPVPASGGPGLSVCAGMAATVAHLRPTSELHTPLSEGCCLLLYPFWRHGPCMCLYVSNRLMLVSQWLCCLVPLTLACQGRANAQTALQVVCFAGSGKKSLPKAATCVLGSCQMRVS